ncbi:MAG: hypothetical protein ACOYOB_20465, partial [Myxococcota bacterium]
MPPASRVFAAKVGTLGVANGHKTTCNDWMGMQTDARASWVFRVFGHDDVTVLDDGPPKSSAKGRPFSDQPVKAAPKTFRPAQDILGKFSVSGIDLGRRVVARCGWGVTAGVLALGAYLVGKDDVAVYDGYWAEWGPCDDVPVATGPGESGHDCWPGLMGHARCRRAPSLTHARNDNQTSGRDVARGGSVSGGKAVGS